MTVVEALQAGRKSFFELQTATRQSQIALTNTLARLTRAGTVVRGDTAPDGSFYYEIAPAPEA